MIAAIRFLCSATSILFRIGLFCLTSTRISRYLVFFRKKFRSENIAFSLPPFQVSFSPFQDQQYGSRTTLRPLLELMAIQYLPRTTRYHFKECKATSLLLEVTSLTFPPFFAVKVCEIETFYCRNGPCCQKPGRDFWRAHCFFQQSHHS